MDSMTANDDAQPLESQIAAWRSHLSRSQAISHEDIEELEDHLRERIASLGEQGLSYDEAFLVAVKRMGAVDALTREFAREHSDRLWKQLVLSGDGELGVAEPTGRLGFRNMWRAVVLAVAAAVAIKLPALFGIQIDGEQEMFYPLNIGFFTLPFVAAYFAVVRPVSRVTRVWLSGAFLLAAILVNALPFNPSPGADTEILTVLHLPIALWLAVGVAYVGGRWRGSERRMDFIRFTGEAFIYYVLIAMGGGVLIAVTFALFQAIGVDVEPVVQNWILPCGIAGATVIASWLVESKQSVIENMAPVLARIFSPLFALLLVAFVATMAWTGQGIDVEREVLIALDFLLMVVFGLLLYSISARDPSAPPGLLDLLQIVLVGTALLVDAIALWAIVARIADFGFTPNRTAALGMNLVLLVNLVWSAVLYVRFLRGRAVISRLLDWQMSYIYVIAAWAAVVAFVFPLLFGFD